MNIELNINSLEKNQLIDITMEIKQKVIDSHIENGMVQIFVPHTTAAVTVNENTDQDVRHDLLKGLNSVFPNRQDYRHYEGNSDAHLKSSVIGNHQTIFIEENQLKLGQWQAIFFCEFDGPRNRHVYLQLMGD